MNDLQKSWISVIEHSLTEDTTQDTDQPLWFKKNLYLHLYLKLYNGSLKITANSELLSKIMVCFVFENAKLWGICKRLVKMMLKFILPHCLAAAAVLGCTNTVSCLKSSLIWFFWCIIVSRLAGFIIKNKRYMVDSTKCWNVVEMLWDWN